MQQINKRGRDTSLREFVTIMRIAVRDNFEPVYGHRQCLLRLSRIRYKLSYPDFFIIPTIIGKADKKAVFLIMVGITFLPF